LDKPQGAAGPVRGASTPIKTVASVNGTVVDFEAVEEDVVPEQPTKDPPIKLDASSRMSILDKTFFNSIYPFGVMSYSYNIWVSTC
jgi:hypothetical protein